MGWLKLGITGQEVYKHLLDTDPRVILAGGRGARPDAMKSSVGVMPYMMMPGDEKVAAERLFAVLSKPPKFEAPPVPSGEPAMVAGQWEAHLEFRRGSAAHTLVLEQKGVKLVGTHKGEMLAGDLHGVVMGQEVRFRSAQRVEGTVLEYAFNGKVNGDSMEGVVKLGEYGEAHWSAKRHNYSS